MSNYHSTMQNAIPETTEWEDLQVKHGNWEAREKPKPPPQWTPEEQQQQLHKNKDAAYMDTMCETTEDLSDLEDDFDDDRFLAQYREQRMKEMKAKEQAIKILPPGHGEPVFIKRDEFIKHVTEAEKGTWVVVHLFKDSHEGCELMSRALAELCKKYVGTKFVKIISTDCIPKYPDQLLPTLILYKDGKMQRNLEGLSKFGGKRISPESVAFELNELFPEDPVLILSGQDTQAQSQAEVVRSAVNRFIKESENRTFSDEEDDLDDY